MTLPGTNHLPLTDQAENAHNCHAPRNAAFGTIASAARPQLLQRDARQERPDAQTPRLGVGNRGPDDYEGANHD